jgi:hypothetical protein
VFEDHLRPADDGDLEGDLARNVAEDVVVLTGRGVFRGHAGVRELARQLMTEVPSGRWTCATRLFEGPMAFLEWTVDDGPTRIRNGADSYLVTDGKIRADGTRTTPD